jgi:hypothetical protein
MGRMKMSDLTTRLRAGIHTSEDEAALRKEAADRIDALESLFVRAEEEVKIADRNRIHYQKELENFVDISMDQRKLIDELRKAIYQYVNHVVSCEGVAFIDVDEPWAKLINQVWDEVNKEEGGEE